MNIVCRKYPTRLFKLYIVSVCSPCNVQHYEWSRAVGISTCSDMGQTYFSPTVPPLKLFENDSSAYRTKSRNKDCLAFHHPQPRASQIFLMNTQWMKMYYFMYSSSQISSGFLRIHQPDRRAAFSQGRSCWFIQLSLSQYNGMFRTEVSSTNPKTCVNLNIYI